MSLYPRRQLWGEIAADFKLNIVNLDTVHDGDKIFHNKDDEGGDLNMCKAITDLIQDGKIEVFVDLINDGDMTVEKAASKLQITEKEFCEQAEALGFKIAST